MDLSDDVVSFFRSEAVQVGSRYKALVELVTDDRVLSGLNP